MMTPKKYPRFCPPAQSDLDDHDFHHISWVSPTLRSKWPIFADLLCLNQQDTPKKSKTKNTHTHLTSIIET